MLEFLHFIVCKNKTIKSDFCILIKSTSTKFYALFSNKNGEILKKQMITIEEIKSLQNYQIFTYRNCLCENEEIKNLVVSHNDYIEYVEYLKSNKKYVTEADLKPIYMAVSQAEEELAKKERENCAKNN